MKHYNRSTLFAPILIALAACTAAPAGDQQACHDAVSLYQDVFIETDHDHRDARFDPVLAIADAQPGDTGECKTLASLAEVIDSDRAAAAMQPSLQAGSFSFDGQRMAAPDPGMAGLALAFLGVGSLVIFAGGLWLLLLGFQQSLAWGLGMLFVPFASLVFAVKYWSIARRPFWVQVAGIAVALLAFIPLRSAAGF